MIKLSDILQEIGDAQSKPYPWKTTVERDDATKYEFKTEQGTVYEVVIDAESDEQGETLGLSVSFKPKDIEKYTSTNEGNQYKIMATVKQILEAYIDLGKKSGSMPIEFIQFVPEKEKGEQDERRFNFYLQYLKKLLPNWKVERSSNNKVIASIK